jgi:hypothetical protein
VSRGTCHLAALEYSTRATATQSIGLNVASWFHTYVVNDFSAFRYPITWVGALKRETCPSSQMMLYPNLRGLPGSSYEPVVLGFATFFKVPTTINLPTNQRRNTLNGILRRQDGFPHLIIRLFCTWCLGTGKIQDGEYILFGIWGGGRDSKVDPRLFRPVNVLPKLPAVPPTKFREHRNVSSLFNVNQRSCLYPSTTLKQNALIWSPKTATFPIPINGVFLTFVK